MKDSYFLAFEQVSCRLLSLLEVPVRANWVGREVSREEARQIVENVTGFFSVLYEWSCAEAPNAANDNEQTAVRALRWTLRCFNEVTMKRERVVAFPFACRRGVILRLAEQMAAREPVAAERYIRQQLRRQIEALHRRQVPDRTVEREIRALESAVRAELWRLVLTPSITPPGAA